MRRRWQLTLRLQISPAEIPFEIMRAREGKNQKAGVKCSVTTLQRPLGPRDLIRRRTQREHENIARVCVVSCYLAVQILDHSVVIMSAVLPTHHRRRRRRCRARSIHICSSTLALFEQIFIASNTHGSHKQGWRRRIRRQLSASPKNRRAALIRWIVQKIQVLDSGLFTPFKIVINEVMKARNIFTLSLVSKRGSHLLISTFIKNWLCYDLQFNI
jgi:hypothetical protein